MKAFSVWINIFIISFVTSQLVLALPTDEEPAKRSNDMGPLMQTLLSDIAKQLIARSTTNSQVMTLNLTNLIILIVLKGLLWGASYAGNTGFPKARSEDGEAPTEPFITETEILLLLSYLIGDEEKDFQCLHRIACEDPAKAQEYINAGTIMTNAAKFIGLNPVDDQRYEKMLNHLEEAVRFKENGGKCETRYSCNQHEIDNNSI